jgi:hypothetical protein
MTIHANPSLGAVFIDQNGHTRIWMGSSWVVYNSKKDTDIIEEFSPPTKEHLEKHPALKEAWEEFLVIKKLVGV